MFIPQPLSSASWTCTWNMENGLLFFFFSGRSRPLLEPVAEATTAAAVPEAQCTFLAFSSAESQAGLTSGKKRIWLQGWSGSSLKYAAEKGRLPYGRCCLWLMGEVTQARCDMAKDETDVEVWGSDVLLHSYAAWSWQPPLGEPWVESWWGQDWHFTVRLCYWLDLPRPRFPGSGS